MSKCCDQCDWLDKLQKEKDKEEEEAKADLRRKYGD